jgi:hypothetical protein
MAAVAGLTCRKGEQRFPGTFLHRDETARDDHSISVSWACSAAGLQ